MHERATFRRALALLLVLLFQAQVFAAATLPCRHGHAQGADTRAHPCHGPALSVGDSEQGGVGEDWLFGCPTCTLLSVAGVFTPQAAPQVGIAPAPPHRAAQERYFYRFFPDRLERPPALP
jgi:hypothetical protein